MVEKVFNESLANILQHISIFLEALGLSLTYIEVLHSDVADKIEEFIDNRVVVFDGYVISIRSKTIQTIKRLNSDGYPQIAINIIIIFIIF